MQNLQNDNKLFLDDKKIINEDIKEYDFSKYSNLDDFSLDKELLEKFKPIAQKLKLNQESVEMLLDIAYQMSKKQDETYKKDKSYKQESLIEKYSQLFDEDSEIPSKNSLSIEKYMRLADGAYKEFASENLKETFKEYGLIYNPELIKMFHKIGEIMEEDSISFNGKPVIEELSPAQILYSKKND